MYLFLISSIVYLFLSYILLKKSRYVAIIVLYGALYFLLMFFITAYPDEILLKIYFSLAFFVDSVGIYVLISILAEDRRIVYGFTFIFVVLGILGTYLTFMTPIGMTLTPYFFLIDISIELWQYSQYALFYPGIIIIFFLGIVGIENINNAPGKRLLIFAVQSFTFGMILYFTIIDSIFALIFYIFNLLGAVIILIWEVVQRYLS